MGEFTAGDVIVPVVPSARGFINDLKKEILPGAHKLGQDIGRDIQRGISDTLKGVYEPLKEETRKQQQRAPRDGEETAGAFARGFKSRLQAAFQSLPKAEIDAESSAAQAAIAEIRARMAELSGKTVGVDVDAAAALTQVAEVRQQLLALDSQDVSADVRVDIASAVAELAAIQAQVSALDGTTALARVDVDVSGALASVGMLTVALVGLSVIPVGASLAAGVAAVVGPLAAAGAGFAGFAAVAVPSVGRISEALKEQEQATEAAAKATKSASQTAAEAAQNSLALQQAEQRITDAKKDAKQAEQDLTQARKDAKQAMDDLARSVKDAALSEEDAALSVEEARKRLDKVRADPKATDLEKKRAELSYRQAVQHLDDQKARTKKLKEDQAAADKAGIEGSKQVKGAKDRLAAASRRVKDAEAQLKVLRLQQAAAAAKESQATGGLLTKMAKLSPAAKAAAKQVKAFQDAYLKWQEKLEPAVLPVVTGGLKLIQKLFKPLTPLVTGTAGALVTLEKKASKALGGKFWQDFFKQLSDQAPGAITGLGKSLFSIGRGVAGLIKAFLPFTPVIVGGIQKAAAAFAKFGTGLGKSDAFHAFIAYARENGPKVIEVVKNIFTVVKNLVTGLSGTGSGALDVIVSISQYLASLSPETLRTLTLVVLGVVAAFKTWKVITTVVDGVKKGIQTVSSVVSGAKAGWGLLSKAAAGSARLVKGAASGIASAARGIGKGAGKAASAVWSGISTAASKAAAVAKTSASAIAGAARSAGAAAARGASAAWSGITTAASKAGSAARVAGVAIIAAGKAAATAAISLGRVAFQYAAIATQAALSAAKQMIAAAAQRAVALATTVWAAAQRVLNLVFSANPIGLIITAVGLLVAALVYAWNNSETFRNIVMGAWEAIKAAISAAWTNFIQPALQALVTFWKTVLAPAITWLWQNVFKPAWDGIAAAVEWAWKNVIQPNLLMLKTLFTQVIGPAVTWLWKNVFKPGFEGIAALVKVAWVSVIKPALDAMVALWKSVLAPAVTWLWKTIIKPAWDGISQGIQTAWTKVIKPVFDFLVGFITKDIPDGFKKGVSLIGQFWDGVKEVAKKPVQFIVDVVYNNGIVKIWNAVADILGMKDKKLSPLKFARGGIMPGYTPGRDVALAAVSGGEAIMRPEWTRAVGEDYVHGANAAARKGGVGGVARFLGVAGDPGFAGAFAGGGIVGSLRDLLAGGLKAGAEKFLNPLLDQASKAMGDSPWAKMLTGVPKTMVANVIKWIGDHDSGGGDGGKALAFAKAQIGKPYKWGGTGPDAFDCSGLVMRAWQSAGVTDIPRVSQAQMAWVHPVAKPRPGDLGFPHPGHVWMYSSPASKIVEAPYTGAKIREVAARSAQLIGRPPSIFDSGGLLEPGTSLVHNGTGRPEPVLTDRQWKAIAQVPVKGGDGGKALVNIEGDYIAENGMSPYEAAREFRYQLGSQIRPF